MEAELHPWNTSFQWTDHKGPFRRLSETQVAQFDSDGFCIVENLLANAVRYTEPGGIVRLVWRASRAGAEFAVEDTGIGIEKQHIPRLTERFYRVDRDRSRHSGGTGLGLAIVKQAVSRHQGTLEIESEPGRGSRFTAHFPAQRVVAARSTALH